LEKGRNVLEPAVGLAFAVTQGLTESALIHHWKYQELLAKCRISNPA
jgi:hypothetical protein